MNPVLTTIFQPLLKVCFSDQKSPLLISFQTILIKKCTISSEKPVSHETVPKIPVHSPIIYQFIVSYLKHRFRILRFFMIFFLVFSIFLDFSEFFLLNKLWFLFACWVRYSRPPKVYLLPCVHYGKAIYSLRQISTNTGVDSKTQSPKFLELINCSFSLKFFRVYQIRSGS